MAQHLLLAVLALNVAVLVMLIVLLRRKAQLDPVALEPSFDRLQQGVTATQAALREELARAREEASSSARGARGELATNLKAVADSLHQQLALARESSTGAAKGLREEVGATLKGLNDSMVKATNSLGEAQRQSFEGFRASLQRLTEANEARLESLKVTMEAKLEGIREHNGKQLEAMRATVEEKLQSTLEKRLGESFKQVSERLEQVHKGLGEMQSLASGVGDLKKVLTNVKTRGTWGEVQLGALLEQMLSPDQYAPNVATRGGAERVEFAIKLPGRDDDQGVVWLPIDAKFPMEDYQRLAEAQDRADAAAAEAAAKQLEARVRGCAKGISEKYLEPPKTTDVGILFLPTEGLFAEVVRRPGLLETLQSQYRVMVAGPTTLYALLNSLRLGFKTLAIEKRSSEVKALLGAVKKEFAKYEEILDKVHKKLEEATKTIDEEVRKRTRVINRRLRDVETPSAIAAADVLKLEAAELEPDEAADRDTPKQATGA